MLYNFYSSSTYQDKYRQEQYIQLHLSKVVIFFFLLVGVTQGKWGKNAEDDDNKDRA